MRSTSRLSATLLGTLALLVAVATPGSAIGVGGRARDDDLILRAINATAGLGAYDANPSVGIYEWKRDLPCWSRAPEVDDVSHDLCWGGSAIQHEPPECEDGEALQPDFGDGERPLETTSPGHPYPDHDLARSYREAGRAQITLHTTWTGRYRVDIDPLHKWRDIDGTAFTTSSTPEFEIVELRSHLDG